MDSPSSCVHHPAFLSPWTLLSCHRLGCWVIGVSLRPGLGNERLLAASLLPLPATTLAWARRLGHPHFTVETDEAPPGDVLFPRSCGKVRVRGARPQSPSRAAWLCTWPPGGLLLYYFPGSLLIVRTKRLVHPLNTARCVIVRTAEPVTQNLPS